MTWCDDCDRHFVNEDALQQHFAFAAVHRPVKVWNHVCQPCNFGFDRLEDLHKHDEEVHHWCKEHNRYFRNENDLRQHKASKSHGQSMQCPFCDRIFPTITGVTLHLESGTCTSGMNRRKVDQRVHEMDTRGAVTNRRRIGYGEWEPEPDIWATDAAWNGRAFECYFCDREYNTLGGLNGHITQIHAPKRTEKIYTCPGCGKEFKLFSQLIGHVEHTGICPVKANRGLKGMLVGGVGHRRLTMA